MVALKTDGILRTTTETRLWNLRAESAKVTRFIMDPGCV